MIIDLILDRRDAEKYGVFDYSAHDFYIGVMGYGATGHDITRAMDGGTESDTRRALCDYIDNNDYNPLIKNYINARIWNDNTNEPRAQIEILKKEI